MARGLLRSRADLALENLALRQQLAAYARDRPRPKLSNEDRAFWVILLQHFDRWADALVIVKPATIIRWHRNGFKYWWRWKSPSRRPGRPALDLAARRLIRRMATDNLWRAPRIARELARLGIDVHPDTGRRYAPKFPPTDEQRRSWRPFLSNHRDVIAAMDLFAVPTVTFDLLYGFVAIHHARRAVAHFNVTFHPSATWVIQQLREAFPFDTPPKCLILDNDSIFFAAVTDFLRSIGVTPVRTAYRSPSQNGVAERWIGSFRRERLDHVIVLGEEHLRRLGRSYVSYYNEDRCHMTLDGDSLAGRPVQSKPTADARVVPFPRAAGFHHRYEWRRAA